MQHKVEETDTIMAEVEMVSQQYLPLSTACSSMYFTLESLNQVMTTPTSLHYYYLCIIVNPLILIHNVMCHAVLYEVVHLILF